MRLLLAACLVAAAAAFTPSHLTGQSLVDYVNEQKSTWTASRSVYPLKQMVAKLMDPMYLRPRENGQVEEEKVQPALLDTLPESFDARQQWPHCASIGTIRDQADCGSCWAFGSAEAMSDRICIATKGDTQVSLSADDIMSCCTWFCGNGCEGGYPYDAWKYWVSHGIVTGSNYTAHQGCKPYPIAPCGNHTNEPYYHECKEEKSPKCEHSCQAGYPLTYDQDKHWGKTGYKVRKSEEEIMQEIYQHGPVTATYTVYEDFYHYNGGVYQHLSGSQLGGHAVRMLGWGVDGGIKYWLIANSWNTDWGEHGFFRILRGQDECGIESGITAGEPKI